MVYYNLSSYNKNMFLMGLFSWWYGKGWLSQIQIIKRRLIISIDFFSISILLSTLFDPFRQISAGSAGVSVKEQFEAFFDKTLSRIIGMFVRIAMIIVGSLVIVAQIVFGIILLILWLAVPAFPVIGLLLWISGVVIR